MNQFEEYLEISEFLRKVRDKVNDRCYTDVSENNILLILGEYEAFKKETKL